MLKKLSTTIFLILLCSSFSFSQSIQIKNGWYYINGEKFFVKGIGYSTHSRPGQVSWIYSFDPDLIKFDLDRIKNAGFNTIRTWGELSEDELKLVDESGLKILFGIWIDPAGDFGNSTFIANTVNQVNNILSYSSKYNCIIGYLIMNEPQVENIYSAGAQSLSNLWQLVINLIHQKHPGVPVSFSNTMIGDYINMRKFDFAGYNAYIYNPVTITASHGYSGFLHFLKQNRSAQMPLIITEYGLSVSPPNTNQDYGYGGNTLEQQTSGDLLMYRDVLDAGVQGNCVFQYHDGWQKAGNDSIHDPSPEEWFGLIEFSNLNDKYGEPRPVWNAYERYNKAIITDPKNGNIYNDTIPLEFFTTDDVSYCKIFMSDSLIYSKPISSTHYTDELNLSFNQNIKDVILNYYFFNTNNDTLKSESISVLCKKNDIELTQVKIEISPGTLQPGGRNFVNMEVTKDTIFNIEGNKIDYVLHPHLSFAPGIAKSKIMTFNKNYWSYPGYFDIPSDTKVATFGAGITITYGTFKKRIYDQKILLDGGWANSIAAPELISAIRDKNNSTSVQPSIYLYQNYPNPFNPTTIIKYSIPNTGTSLMKFVQLKVYDILGREDATLVNEEKLPGIYEAEFNTEKFNLPSGIYFYQLRVGNYITTKKMILLH